MSGYIIYHFDELEPWPGQCCYIWGSATLTYSWSDADPGTGWRGGPTNIRLQSLVISGTNESMIVPYGSRMFEAAARVLEADEHVAQKCVEDWQNA